MTDIFDGISGAKASRDANYIRPGVYCMLVDNIKWDKNRSKVEFVAVEMTNLATIAAEKDEQSGATISHRAGESVTDMYMAGGPGVEMFLPNIKAMVMALVGCAESEVDKEACKVMVSPAQPMAGIVAKVQARETTTRKGGNYTKVTYQGVYAKEEFEELGLPVPEGAVFAHQIPGYAAKMGE